MTAETKKYYLFGIKNLKCFFRTRWQLNKIYKNIQQNILRGKISGNTSVLYNTPPQLTPPHPPHLPYTLSFPTTPYILTPPLTPTPHHSIIPTKIHPYASPISHL
jgi:hypothetical protein